MGKRLIRADGAVTHAIDGIAGKVVASGTINRNTATIRFADGSALTFFKYYAYQDDREQVLLEAAFTDAEETD